MTRRCACGKPFTTTNHDRKMNPDRALCDECLALRNTVRRFNSQPQKLRHVPDYSSLRLVPGYHPMSAICCPFGG